MNADYEPGVPMPSYEELRKRWLWYVVLGGLIVAVGLGAIAYSVLATLTTVVVIGIVLLVAGVAQLIGAVMARSWRGFFIAALIGLLHLVLGVVMIEHPLRAAVVLTLVMAVSFLVGGIARILYSLTHKFSGRGWVMFNGFITLLLGGMIWQDWPEASLWAIGLFAGIDLVFSGWSWVAFGMAVKADVFTAPRGAATVAAAQA